MVLNGLKENPRTFFFSQNQKFRKAKMYTFWFFGVIEVPKKIKKISKIIDKTPYRWVAQKKVQFCTRRCKSHFFWLTLYIYICIYFQFHNFIFIYTYLHKIVIFVCLFCFYVRSYFRIVIFSEFQVVFFVVNPVVYVVHRSAQNIHENLMFKFYSSLAHLMWCMCFWLSFFKC